jgi:hypothetical protein
MVGRMEAQTIGIDVGKTSFTEWFRGTGNIVVKMRFTKTQLVPAWKRVVAPTISEPRQRGKSIQCDWYRHNSYVLW